MDCKRMSRGDAELAVRRYLIPLLVSQGRWFNRRGRSRGPGAALDEDGQTTRIRACGFYGADDGCAGRRQMEPLPSCLVRQGDQFGKFLD